MKPNGNHLEAIRKFNMNELTPMLRGVPIKNLKRLAKALATSREDDGLLFDVVSEIRKKEE